MFGLNKKRKILKQREIARKELVTYLQLMYRDKYKFGDTINDGSKFIGACENTYNNQLYTAYTGMGSNITIVTIRDNAIEELIDKWIKNGKDSIKMSEPRPLQCKSPEEIALMLKSFETRNLNLSKTIPHMGLTMRDRDKIIKLEAKIHILKNILKYTD